MAVPCRLPLAERVLRQQTSRYWRVTLEDDWMVCAEHANGRLSVQVQLQVTLQQTIKQSIAALVRAVKATLNN